MNDVNFPHLVEFLKKVLPFSMLTDEDLNQIISETEIAFHQRGETLVRMGEKPGSYVFVVQKGAVRVTITEASGSEMLVDIRGEGEVFGLTNLSKCKESLFNFSAQEDVLLLQIPAETVEWAMQVSDRFCRFVNASLARNFKAIKKSAEEQLALLEKSGSFDIDMILTRKRVHELMEKDVLICDPETSVRQAAGQMKKRNVSSIVVCREGALSGIVTDSDLRNYVLAEGLRPCTPVSDIMSAPPHTIPYEASAFDALLLMSRFGISQVMVTDNLRLVGIISDHDIQMEMGSSPVGLIGTIDKARTLGELVTLRPHIDRILHIMMRRSDSVKPMVDLIAQINNRVTGQMVHIVQNQMLKEGLGPPPVPYCWLTMGSEGRGEQTLCTDQDNGIIYMDALDADAERTGQWYLRLAERVVDALVKFGIRRCAGGIMASNPQWCRPVSEWQALFTQWINTADPFSLKMATICFDLRCINENFEPANMLKEEICRVVGQNIGFLRRLAGHALRNRPPLSFFRQFVVEKAGAHKNQLNLKLRGMTPIVDAVRVMALEVGTTKTNTLDRLQEIEAAGMVDPSFGSEIRDAYDYINFIRISCHLKLNKITNLPTNFVDPRLLTHIQKNMLKESFAVVRRLQEIIESRYQTRVMPAEGV